MATWQDFEQQAPALAAAGRERLDRKIAFLATLRKDGSPRLHPVRPFLAGKQLILFSSPPSPKTADLRRDPRFSLHPTYIEGGQTGGELLLSGTAREILDPDEETEAEADAPFPAGAGVLFALGLERAVGLIDLPEEGLARARWSEAAGFSQDVLGT